VLLQLQKDCGGLDQAFVEVPAFPGSVQPQLFQDVVGLVVCLRLKHSMKPVKCGDVATATYHHNHRNSYPHIVVFLHWFSGSGIHLPSTINLYKWPSRRELMVAAHSPLGCLRMGIAVSGFQFIEIACR